MLFTLEYICGRMSQSSAPTTSSISSSAMTMARARLSAKARRWSALNILSTKGVVRLRSKKTIAGRSR